MNDAKVIDRSYALPPLGDNPSTERQGTTPGSFANAGRIGSPLTYSSPDTPGMPPPSDKTAWDFLPQEWSNRVFPPGSEEDDVELFFSSDAIRFNEASGAIR